MPSGAPYNHLAGGDALSLTARHAAHEVVADNDVRALLKSQQPNHVLQRQPGASTTVPQLDTGHASVRHQTRTQMQLLVTRHRSSFCYHQRQAVANLQHCRGL